jgi:putative ATPase
MFTAKPYFIDEIHRLVSHNRLLACSGRKGWITLIGATTENPSFEVIPALLSRCQVYVLNAFKADLESLLQRGFNCR